MINKPNIFYASYLVIESLQEGLIIIGDVSNIIKYLLGLIN